MLEDVGQTEALYVLVPFAVVALYMSLHQDLTIPVIVLIAASAVCLIIILNGVKAEKKKKITDNAEGESIKEQIVVKPTDGAETIVAKLKLCQTLEESPVHILEAIRRICRRKGGGRVPRSFINTALDLNLHKRVMECVVDLPPHKDSEMFGLCGDILIDLFRKQQDTGSSDGGAAQVALGSLKSNKTELRELVDGIVQFLQNQLRKLKQLEGAMGPAGGSEQQPFYAAAGEHGAGAKSATSSSSSSPFSPLSFAASGYKYVMLLGFLSMDCDVSQSAQTVVGDRGGVQVVLDYLSYFYAKRVEYVKWCSWSLIHITYASPPNKLEFVQYGGIMTEIRCLRHYTEAAKRAQKEGQPTTGVALADAAAYYQVLGLLCSVLAHDGQAKLNLAHVRQLVLSEGIVDLTDSVLKQTRTPSGSGGTSRPPTAIGSSTSSLNDIDEDQPEQPQPRGGKEDQRLSEVVSSLLEVIMSDWS